MIRVCIFGVMEERKITEEMTKSARRVRANNGHKMNAYFATRKYEGPTVAMTYCFQFGDSAHDCAEKLHTKRGAKRGLSIPGACQKSILYKLARAI